MMTDLYEMNADKCLMQHWAVYVFAWTLDALDTLYVGLRHDTDPSVLRSVRSLGIAVDVLEVWPANCAYAKSLDYVRNVFQEDVRNIAQIGRVWDTIIWLHGPEHIAQEELAETLRSVEECARHGVLVQAPIGFYPNGAEYGNPFEEHLSHLTPGVFEEQFGYDTLQHTGPTAGGSTENTFSAWKMTNPSSDTAEFVSLFQRRVETVAQRRR